MFLPQVFIHMFTNDTHLVEIGVWAIRIYMGSALLFGIQIACQQTFIALGNAKSSIFLAVLRKDHSADSADLYFAPVLE